MNAKSDCVALGIIGAGNIATRHLANLQFVGGNRVLAVADSRVDAAKEKAEPVGANAYADWEQMFEKERALDGVLLCTPPTVRETVFEAAASRKIAVFCEKPPAKDLDEARAITHIVRDSGIISSVGFNWRYAPSVDRCRELLRSRTANIVRAAVLLPIALPPRELDNWFYLKQRGGGQFDGLIHELDLIRDVAGDVADVQAFGSNVVLPKSDAFTIEDTMSINLRFASGATGTVASSWACAQGLRDLTFFGENFQISLTAIPPMLRGRIGAKGAEAQVIDEDFPQGPDMGRSGTVHPDRKPHDPPDPPHCEELKVFLEAIRTGSMEKVRSPFADAARTMALVDAIARSIDSGRVEQVQRDL